VDTNFSRDLFRLGWIPAYNKYSLHSSSSRYANKTRTKPTLYTPIILMPLHVQDSHWVSLIRRNIDGRLHFYYADDMNSPNTAHMIRHHLSPIKTSAEIHPSNAIWHNCLSYTYLPHSNECGPRTLLALSVFALHPNPSQYMLLPYMNNNIAQISRWWVARCILNLAFPCNIIKKTANSHLVHFPPSWNQVSDPANLASLPDHQIDKFHKRTLPSVLPYHPYTLIMNYQLCPIYLYHCAITRPLPHPIPLHLLIQWIVSGPYPKITHNKKLLNG
jgi:hypothetical protein